MKSKHYPMCRDCIFADVLDSELADQLVTQGLTKDELADRGLCRLAPTATGQWTIVRLRIDGCSKGRRE